MPLHLLSSIIELYENDNECSPEILEGLKQFISTMKDYLNLIPAFEKNIKESEITLHLYVSFTLPNKDQVRATKNYHNAPMFSDIAVYMDSEQEIKTFSGYCFAKVLLLVCIELENTTTLNLALIR
ncbi:12675_t:CDS:2 [Cetraspora pellucida]|uniref:12675_t:CDS:1 n=1 Tax=Cetraspora pellucida TaxID=1433469 RepID=A0A9N9I064_9GLOM|nr:12675_t:CDS:2 [Cetraspora pellucida]